MTKVTELLQCGLALCFLALPWSQVSRFHGPLLTGNIQTAFLAGAAFLVERDYKITAIYVLACFVFLRERGSNCNCYECVFKAPAGEVFCRGGRSK